MGEELHIQLVNGGPSGSKFDASFGSLILAKAGSFGIKVKEYDEEYQNKLKKNNDALKFAEDKWRERAKAGWTKEKLQENWKANENERKTSDKSAQDTLENKFSKVNWVWTVAPKKLTASDLTHNDSFNVGIKDTGEYQLTFPKILEGGGMAYLEAFVPSTGAKGAKPFGIFVQATGTPRIVRVEWTDFNYNLLKGKVAFNSEVLLHIYTEALYGQELEINLFDEDTFSDDELNISKKSAFQREVNIHKVHPKELGKAGVADTLVKADQDKTDLKVEKEHYLQKITIEVKVDYGWMQLAGGNLKIYPTVKSRKTGKYFENFSREFLQVSTDGVLYDVQKEVTNMPVVQSEIETNIAAYHPCQYIAIDYLNDKDEATNVFTEQQGVGQNSSLEIGIIVGSDPKKFSVKVDDNANTTDCNFDGKPKDHNKHIFAYDRTKLPVNVSISSNLPKRIDGQVFFDYDKINLFEYLFLPESKLKNLPRAQLYSNTCRYSHTLFIKPVPDIKWEGYVLITNKNAESYAPTNMPGDKDSFGDPIVTDDNGKPTRKNIFEIHQKKARETGVKAKKVNQDFTGEIHLKASYNDSKQVADYGAFIEDRLKVILDKISSVKGILDAISHRDEATKGKAQGAMSVIKPVVGNSKSKLALPVFIEFSWPTVRLGGGWYWKYVEEEKQIKCIGNLQYGLEPLIQGKGGIDLVAAAEYVPVVKPVLTALRYVKKGAQWLCDNTPVQINAELYFNLYVKGKIDFRQTIDFYHSDYDKTELKATMLLGIELGFKIKATIEKIIYTKGDRAGGQEISKTGFDGQLSAEAESGFVATAAGGRDEKGTYMQITLDFTGITIKVVGKLAIYRPGKKVSNYGINDKFDLIDYTKNIVEPVRHDFI